MTIGIAIAAVVVIYFDIPTSLRLINIHAHRLGSRGDVVLLSPDFIIPHIGRPAKIANTWSLHN